MYCQGAKKTIKAVVVGVLLLVSGWCVAASDYRHGWAVTVVDAVGDVGKYTSLAIDHAGNPYISYYNGSSGDLQVAHRNGSQWSIEVVDSVGNVGEFTSLALDSSGYPHISYYDETNGDLKYACWNGSGWVVQTLDSEGNVGLYTSLALDDSGNPYISYYDLTHGELKCYCINSSSLVDDAGDVGMYSSLALDSENHPRVSYYDATNQALKYAAWNGTAWAIETIHSNYPAGKFTCLKIDSEDCTYISYLNLVDITLIHWNGSGWVDDADWWVGSFDSSGSFALDSNGAYYVCLYDSGWGLYYDGPQGYYQVDASGDVGNFNCIAVKGNATIMISYYDATNQDLRLAEWSATANRPPYTPWMACYDPVGGVNMPYDFYTATWDPEHDQVYFWFDWGDGTNSTWLGPYQEGRVCECEHAWAQPGVFTVRVKAKDTFGAEGPWSAPFNITIVPPPYPPETPKGPASGYCWLRYSYQTVAYDPLGFPLDYWVNWGDGSQESIGRHPSGALVNMTHIWKTPGVYQVKVRVWDQFYQETPWSSPLNVSIQTTLLMPSVKGGFGIHATLVNSANVSLSNVSWSIQVVGGLFHKVNRTTKGVIHELVPGTTVLTMPPFLGLGEINIRVSVTYTQATIGRAMFATQLFYWTRLPTSRGVQTGK